MVLANSVLHGVGPGIWWERQLWERGLGFEDDHPRRLYMLIWHRLGAGGKEEKKNASQQCLECISCAKQNSWENQAVSWIVVQGTSKGIQSFSF